MTYDGTELVVNFHLKDFDNKNTFYTDSNGLEMQKRVLNYRPTWDIQTNYNQSDDNITANFYPINSAISMKDGDRVFTVMNDRSQSGACLSPGNIELMQNRLVPADDGKGMGEWLVEEGEDGHLIRVPATYYVQIFNEKTSKSLQRLVQKKQESPAEYFYTFDLMKIASEPVKNTLSDDLKKAGVSDKVNLKMFPQ